LDDAIASYQEAIRFKKDHGKAQTNLGALLYDKGRWAEAEAAFQEALRSLPKAAITNSNLAWLLSNCPDTKFRDIPRAVQLAKKATAVAPGWAFGWATLGVARCRAGQWKEAVADLEKATRLPPDPNNTSLRASQFVLAMAQWQSGDKEKAGKTFSKAVEWMDQHRPEDAELRRFRAEAAALLGIADERNAPGKDKPAPQP
jgi:tetratricopeptide (TPR) repeat protein